MANMEVVQPAPMPDPIIANPPILDIRERNSFIANRIPPAVYIKIPILIVSPQC